MEVQRSKYSESNYGLIAPYLSKFTLEDEDHIDDSEYYSSDDDLRVANPHQGYDVDCTPPSRFGSPFMPRDLSEEKNKKYFDKVTKVANFAIQQINVETNKEKGITYELVKVEKVVETRNFMMLLTFNAREIVANASADAAVKTLRANGVYTIV